MAWHSRPPVAVGITKRCQASEVRLEYLYEDSWPTVRTFSSSVCTESDSCFSRPFAWGNQVKKRKTIDLSSQFWRCQSMIGRPRCLGSGETSLQQKHTADETSCLLLINKEKKKSPDHVHLHAPSNLTSSNQTHLLKTPLPPIALQVVKLERIFLCMGSYWETCKIQAITSNKHRQQNLNLICIFFLLFFPSFLILFLLPLFVYFTFSPYKCFLFISQISSSLGKKMKFCYTTQANLKIRILLPQSLEYQEFRHGLPTRLNLRLSEPQNQKACSNCRHLTSQGVGKAGKQHKPVSVFQLPSNARVET